MLNFVCCWVSNSFVNNDNNDATKKWGSPENEDEDLAVSYLTSLVGYSLIFGSSFYILCIFYLFGLRNTILGSRRIGFGGGW